MCTNVPPAKSSAPSSSSQPPPAHTQWATGAYTMVTHRTTKTTKALNFIRSAKAPVTRAGVIMANIPWNAMNNISSWEVTPDSPNRDRSPTNPPTSGPKARL